MKILALVLAGGEGTRLHPLTAEHAKPAVPFVNGYRIVDFVLSNLVNSKISTIYVLAQYKPQSLIKHVETTWAPWSGSRIQVVLPRSDNVANQFKGTADAVYQNLALVERHRPDLVAVFAADHVYRMDVRQMVDSHWEREADVTVAAVPVPLESAPSFGVIATDVDGCITEFQEKPALPATIPTNPARAYASMGNYLFDSDVLAGVLEAAKRDGGTDFGRDIMPRLPHCCRVFAYDFASNDVPGIQPYEEPGYWRDVGTIDALAAAQSDVSGSQPRFNLWNPQWPIRSGDHARLLTKIRDWKARSGKINLPADAVAPQLKAVTGLTERLCSSAQIARTGHQAADAGSSTGEVDVDQPIPFRTTL
jgi:glucose-1-phosphate adenylyltransferase